MSHVEAPRLYPLVTHFFFDGQVTVWGDEEPPRSSAALDGNEASARV
jgi:hypothetical protein